ncbi:hypothetical protein BGW80DRAFT_932691 [Lactifluus volemus]|nr:hypothetical protein BGW80DRAFT_932691 [Lactifluus volemus]
MASDADIGEREYGEDGRRRPTEVVPPTPLLPPVQFWLPGYPAYKLNYTAHHHTTGGATRSEAAGTSEDRQGGRRHHHHHRDRHASSVSSLSSLGLLDLRLMPPPPPPPPPLLVFLALGARCACIPYTPAFQGIDIRRASSQCEKLAMRDAISVFMRLGVRVTGAEASKRGDVEFELHRNHDQI